MNIFKFATTILILLIIFIPTSCKIEKRKYNKGFYISKHSKNRNNSGNSIKKFETSSTSSTDNSLVTLQEMDENKMDSMCTNINEREGFTKKNLEIKKNTINKLQFPKTQNFLIKDSFKERSKIRLNKEKTEYFSEKTPSDFYSIAKGSTTASIVFFFTLIGWPLYIFFLCYSEYWVARYIQAITNNTSSEYQKIKKIKRLNRIFLIILTGFLVFISVSFAIFLDFEFSLLLIIPALIILLCIISKKLGSSQAKHGSSESKSANNFYLSIVFLIAYPLYVYFFFVSIKNAIESQKKHQDKNSVEYKKAKLLIILNWLLFFLWTAIILAAAILISIEESAIFLLIIPVPLALAILLPVYFGNKKR